ncbi:family 78 glycoside hydrolase catalytic domain [Tessaracoccus defluvii]|uniref:family 78 glycoside hydrolase catalytic domain n=1 Tax=Tessaracoccus defluvii TaxID=1285901 RepID=UPI0031D2A627
MPQVRSASPSQPAAPRALKADGLTEPIGSTSRAPRLTWRHDGRQASAFLVRAHDEAGAELFAVEIDGRSHALAWPAAPLADLQRVSWSVTALADSEELGRADSWLETAFDGAWPAAAVTHPAWLEPGADPGPLPELRTSFHLDAPVRSARLYLTGEGVVVPLINGAEAIAGQLEPGYGVPGRYALASAWDVTTLLVPGRNGVELRLGAGTVHAVRGPDRYAKFEHSGHPVWAAALIRVQLVDGRVIEIPTDATWEARQGPIAVSSWFGGERVAPGETGPWGPCAVITALPDVWWRATPPIVVTETLAPVGIEVSGPADLLIDFGLNSAGRPRLTLRDAVPGEPVTLRPGELVRDGRVDQANTGSPIFDRVVPETAALDWRPVTVYHGARYVEATGLTAEDAAATRFEVMRAGNEQVGRFSSSHPVLGPLHTMIDRAIASNMYAVFTDCPHREKLGWLEQLHYCFTALTRTYDVQAHMTEMVRHMVAAQQEDGLVPNIAPELVVFNDYAIDGDQEAFRSDVNWGRAVIEVPLRLYRHYGDPRVVEEAFPGMVRYLDYVRDRAVDGIIDFGLGDWIALASTPRAMATTHGWALALESASACAEIVGEQVLAARYREEAHAVWTAFGETFRAADGTWGSGSQGSLALAWSNPLLADEERACVYRGLLDAIRDAGDAFTVGENALPFLLEALSTNGDDDLLLRILERPDVPGYGLQVASGSTALTESWEGSEGTDGVISQNHFMLGAIEDWLMERVGGLRQAPGSVGWASVEVAPVAPAGVDDAETVFDSPVGRFRVAWRRTDRGVELEVEAPPGVDVAVKAPADWVLHPIASAGGRWLPRPPEGHQRRHPVSALRHQVRRPDGGGEGPVGHARLGGGWPTQRSRRRGDQPIPVQRGHRRQGAGDLDGAGIQGGRGRSPGQDDHLRQVPEACGVHREALQPRLP